ncbi:MBOAT family O-acyltransferase [Legionella quateirensis]|uniref:Probable alginate O-acetylase n=1 Tax=Legionella quateirensis TaxID=45072 RepID=A0A378KVM3_9GAMM|nr:MBOAT family O-acyltransferase [Legionella quateirensis]KTD47630.1 alginate O-acetylation protein [Legionella quateirensis]STY18615.1 alginate O-acetylation protein [Legionella quateirensis]
MLFNSYLFLFTYLPIALFGTYFFIYFYKPAVVPWLLTFSLIFYGWWNPNYLILLLASIGFNFVIGKLIINSKLKLYKKSYLILGIAGNLSALFYFKYMNFFIENINSIAHTDFNFYNIILPLGISFFTFTQIAFLVDAYYEKVKQFGIFNYSLFVTYFPHLIAGPIIHHKDVMPQFNKILDAKEFPLMRYFMIGLTIFIIGLFKKVCLADTLAPKVNYIFDLPGKGYELSFADSWMGAIGYTLQLYFDFSGYSEMAIGLSFMIGIKLPINFFSPYKAVNIIDFWRRWHMSLSRFFRDYLYIPLGGSRKGPFRKYLNLFIVMVIVGFWHGAGWTFILWGTYHGILLILNHSWHALKEQLSARFNLKITSRWVNLLIKFISIAVTFFCVVIGWVLFRSNDFATAQNFYQGMFHYGHTYYYGSIALLTLLNYVFFGFFLLACLIICTVLPSTIEMMKTTNALLDSQLVSSLNADKTTRLLWNWKPSITYGLIIGAALYFVLTTISETPSTFLYFNF